jgi:OPT oligopeptide transporter protein
MSTINENDGGADRDIPQEDNLNVAHEHESERRPSKIAALFPKEFHAQNTVRSNSIEKGVDDGLGNGIGSDLPAYEADEEEGRRGSVIVETAKDLVTQVIGLEDDPTLNPWTFRTFFLGTSRFGTLHCDKFLYIGMSDDSLFPLKHLTHIPCIGLGLSCFGSVLQEIFYFKPQTIYVSVVFLTVLGYILGEFMALVIPRKGAIGRFLNPGPFNMKEHASITLMASAASQSALATEALAAQELFYGGYPNKAAGIFIVISSQLIGFGLAGLLRDILVYPTHMLWPMNLPITSLLESLHKDKAVAKARLKIFYIVFFTFLVWEIFPEASTLQRCLQTA